MAASAERTAAALYLPPVPGPACFGPQLHPSQRLARWYRWRPGSQRREFQRLPITDLRPSPDHHRRAAPVGVRWRYQYGVDKEALKKDDMQATEEELKKMKAKIQVELTDVEGNIRREKRVIKELTNGRRTEKKGKE